MPRISTIKSNKKLRREYKLRFLTATFLVATCSLLLILLSILPSYTLLNFYERSYKNSEVTAEQKNIQKVNQDYDERLNAVLELSKKVNLEESAHLKVINEITGYAESSITFNAIELLTKEENIEITLRGQSVSREALLAFESKMNNDSNYIGFKIPIEALTKQSDISFNVSFKYNEK